MGVSKEKTSRPQGRLKICLMLALLASTDCAKDPRWVDPGPTEIFAIRHENVAFYMHRSCDTEEPRLEKMKCAFLPEDDQNGQDLPHLDLWASPLSQEEGFAVKYSQVTFIDQITYIGDLQLVELGFLVTDLTEKKSGTYVVELKYENSQNLTHELRIKLADTGSKTTTTHVPDYSENQRTLRTLIYLVGFAVFMMMVISTFLLYFRVKGCLKKKTNENF